MVLPPWSTVVTQIGGILLYTIESLTASFILFWGYISNKAEKKVNMECKPDQMVNNVSYSRFFRQTKISYYLLQKIILNITPDKGI